MKSDHAVDWFVIDFNPLHDMSASISGKNICSKKKFNVKSKAKILTRAVTPAEIVPFWKIKNHGTLKQKLWLLSQKCRQLSPWTKCMSALNLTKKYSNPSSQEDLVGYSFLVWSRLKLGEFVHLKAKLIFGISWHF